MKKIYTINIPIELGSKPVTTASTKRTAPGSRLVRTSFGEVEVTAREIATCDEVGSDVAIYAENRERKRRAMMAVTVAPRPPTEAETRERNAPGGLTFRETK